MNKTLFAFIGLLSFACGSQDPEEGIDDSEVEYGQLSEALTRPSGFGTVDGTNANRCGSTPIIGQTCSVQHDKKTRPLWVTADDSSFAVSATRAFNNTIVRFCADLNAQGWDCAKGNVTTHEVMARQAGGAGEYGSTQYVDCGSFSNNLFKCHGCGMAIDVNRIRADFDAVHGQIALENVMYHELAHCEGLGHKSNTVMQSTLFTSSSIQTMDNADKALFKGYIP